MITIDGKSSSPYYIERKLPFVTRSRNFRAYWQDNCYIVKSYQTTIAEFVEYDRRYDKNGRMTYKGIWYINARTYSSETTQQAYYIMRAIQAEGLVYEDRCLFVYNTYWRQDVLHALIRMGSVADKRRARILKQAKYV